VTSPSPAGCAIVFAVTLLTLVWIVLLVSSLLFRPEVGTGMRMVDRLLTITSFVLLMALGALALMLAPTF
jgi:hypothetical protein